MASTARQWLDQFHDPQTLVERPAQGSFMPRESARLAALGTTVAQTVRAYVTATAPGPTVTLDVDAYLVVSSKRTARPTYDGFRGYHPVLVAWAETGPGTRLRVLADEFRDGNVPAGRGTLWVLDRLVDEAYACLPVRRGPACGCGWHVSVRADSAAYDQALLEHWDEQGWTFVVSADLSPQLRAAITALPGDAWQCWTTDYDGTIREWAEVPFVPSRKTEQRDSQPYRYLAIRVRTP